MNQYMKREFRPGPDVKSDDEVLAYCREYGTTIFHLISGNTNIPTVMIAERAANFILEPARRS